jgi:hypothetical protein
MIDVFILFGLLFAANAYFLMRSRRKLGSGRDAEASYESDDDACQ